MSNLYLDSSALAKRYLPENGTRWLRQTLISADSIIVSRLTIVEVMSAVARRQREEAISTITMSQIQRLIETHFHKSYIVVDVNNALAVDAIRLLTIHPLRAYDASS